MATVRIVGWVEGLKKISLKDLIRAYTGLSLADAKHRVDDVLSGCPVAFSFEDAKTAEAFRSAAEALGAECESDP